MARRESGRPSSIGLPFTHLAFFLTAELTDPVAVDSFADRRTSISRLPLMTKDQWLSGKLPGFQRQAGTAEVLSFVLIARHWLSSGRQLLWHCADCGGTQPQDRATAVFSAPLV